MLIINSWTGRLGNNILQIIRAIHYGLVNNHNYITMPFHKFITKKEIVLNDILDKNNTVKNTFFYLKHFNMEDPEPYIMRNYFQKYISPIFKVQPLITDMGDTDTLYIHFRGGDIFSKHPHKAYVQPPFSYYTTIMKDYKNIKLICEDKSNPCINELLKQENVEFISNSLEDDLKILGSAQNIVIGFGTFGFLSYLMTPNLTNLYLPKYFVDELPKGEWGSNIKVTIVELPGYIKVGEWRNSAQQRKLMLEY